MPRVAALHEPPYYAVIFASLAGADLQGYAAMATSMVENAQAQPGFLGVDSARGDDGLGITVSYWADEASLLAWKANAKHLLAQQMGKERWYKHYSLRVATVERQYEGPEGR